jgi:hypothetical protein
VLVLVLVLEVDILSCVLPVFDDLFATLEFPTVKASDPKLVLLLVTAKNAAAVFNLFDCISRTLWP